MGLPDANIRIKVRVGIPFQIGGEHDQGWHQEFVSDSDKPAFLETDLVWMDTSRSECMTIYVDLSHL